MSDLPAPPADGVPTITRPDYSLGVSETERARLLARAEQHRPQAVDLVERIGVRPGWRTLDLGCGPLGVLDVLAGQVGSTGSVTGVDREPAYLAMASRSLAERDVRGVQLVEADATGTGLPGAAFDLVHERLLLINTPRPSEVLAEMVRLTRPGGYVAVEDFDCAPWACEPGHPEWDRLLAAVTAAWSGDFTIGRRLPALLRDAGTVDVGIAAHTCVYRPGDPEHEWLPLFAEIHRDRILAGGDLGPAELDECVRAVRTHLAHPDSFTLFCPFYQAWGRVTA